MRRGLKLMSDDERKCPDCGNEMWPDGGCLYCPICGYSPCK